MSSLQGRSQYCWPRFVFALGALAGRGIYALEQKYRIMMQMPLLDKGCRPVTAEEDRQIRQERMNEPPVYLESELSLSVDERIVIEEAEASSSERPVLSRESVSFLWLGQYISSFVIATSFGAVMRMVELWRDNMNAELRVECRSLTYPRYQVRMRFLLPKNYHVSELYIYW